MKQHASEGKHHALEFAPAPACENLYYPDPSGSVFVTPSIATRVRVPFYGMVVISTDGPAIEINKGPTSRAIGRWRCGPRTRFSRPTRAMCASP